VAVFSDAKDSGLIKFAGVLFNQRFAVNRERGNNFVSKHAKYALVSFLFFEFAAISRIWLRQIV